MTKQMRFGVLGIAVVLGLECAACNVVRGEETPQRLPTVAEARDRAELLHETIHGALQVVHHEYYREDEGLAIPASTLKKVFQQLADQKRVSARWLVVDGAAMNTDHLPQTEFERKAAAAISSGKSAYEEVAADVYRRAGSITLKSDCLKCHLPNRKSTEDRSAGLILSIPIQRK